jgi:hypothetical protein
MDDLDKLSKEMSRMLNLDPSLEIIAKAYLHRAYDSNANIIYAIDKARKRAIEKGWKYTHWFFDLHETIIKPNYEVGNIPKEFYPNAKETLQIISKRSDIKMHLYTCSWPHEIEQYDKYFRDNDINFDYIDCKNPEVVNDALGYYENKPYVNVLMEDRAGFLPSHWTRIKQYLEEHPDSNINEKCLES